MLSEVSVAAVEVEGRSRVSKSGVEVESESGERQFRGRQVAYKSTTCQSKLTRNP